MKLDLDKLDQRDALLIQHGLRALGLLQLPDPKGLPGPKTMAAYDAWRASHEPGRGALGAPSIAIFRDTLVRVMLSQVGVREEGGNNRGKQIDAYEGATWLDVSRDWAWCASFVCWVIREALKATGYQPDWARPRTPGAYAFRDEWAPANAGRGVAVLSRSAKVLPGDIIVFTFSHVAMARAGSPAGMKHDVLTVEGNTTAKGERDSGGREVDGVLELTRDRKLISKIIRIERV